MREKKRGGRKRMNERKIERRIEREKEECDRRGERRERESMKRRREEEGERMCVYIIVISDHPLCHLSIQHKIYFNNLKKDFFSVR